MDDLRRLQRMLHLKEQLRTIAQAELALARAATQEAEALERLALVEQQAAQAALLRPHEQSHEDLTLRLHALNDCRRQSKERAAELEEKRSLEDARMEALQRAATEGQALAQSLESKRQESKRRMARAEQAQSDEHALQERRRR